ncbi:hypothetical protein TNCV_725551 [Trichonephila clavipes]|nr:hypothetical protein TNCV_725551 [Trichonephila clavipes]
MSRCWGPFHHRVDGESSSGFTPQEMIFAGFCAEDRWIPRGVSFQCPRHRLIAVASLGRLPRNRSLPVWFTRYPRTALSDRWRSLGITSLMNIGGIRYVHIHSYIGHHDQACALAYRWIPRGVSFQRPRHRLIAVASLGRLPRNRSIPVWFTRYPRTALSDRWRSLGITSLMNIGGITMCACPFYIGHHRSQACVYA